MGYLLAALSQGNLIGLLRKLKFVCHFGHPTRIEVLNILEMTCSLSSVDRSNTRNGNGYGYATCLKLWFVFEGIDEGSLNWALDRAFSYYREKPKEWSDVVRKIMEIDNSWSNTAGKYIDVYNSIRMKQ
ncbi:hypothetical protein Acr_29g0007800 [Actinidia rufa]|uniref:starch synthase n=1 Tax=Actinidia rufa TaxID=165716 RepID=A0A7J0HEZ9_9ERIC|nr:hypothetical protein Acr_29g0007800 [Actinidia rufa]